MRRFIVSTATLFAVMTAMFYSVGIAHANFMAYTTEADFLGAITGFVDKRTLDFESLDAGALLPSGSTVDGITFNYSIDDLDMIISDTFDNTSGENSLGINDGGDNVFLSGDTFMMSFDRTIHALGLYVICTPQGVIAGDFELSAGAGSVFNSGTPALILPDTGEAFFLGLVETDVNLGFTSAMLKSFDPEGVGLFEFNVDDITTAVVPEPGTLVLFSTGVLGGLLWRRRLTSRFRRRLSQ